MYNDALDTAREVRDNSVTGLPFGILSNSLIGIGVYALQEKSEIQKQQSKADLNYRIQSNQLDNMYRTATREVEEEVRHAFISDMESAIKTLFNHMYTKYLMALSECGQFDLSCLNGISVERSTEMLKNLSVVDAKEKVIQQALVLCPFNPLVYVRTADVGLFNEELVCLMKYLHISEDVVSMIEYIHSLKEQKGLLPTAVIECFQRPCGTISTILGEDQTETLRRYFPDVKESVIQKIAEFGKYLTKTDSPQRLDEFAAEYCDELEQYQASGDINQFIQKFVCSEKDIVYLSEYFGETDIMAEIANAVGYTENGDVFQYIKNSTQSLLKNVFAWQEEEKLREEARRIEKEKDEEFVRKLEKAWHITIGLSTLVFFLFSSCR